MRTLGSTPLLALDTASAHPSVALARSGEPSLRRSAPPRACSESLLELVDEILTEARIAPRELGGVVALRGPGSFTGLRVGLATVMGLHEALSVPATALGTLEVLAEAGFERSGEQRCLAVVDALRDHWYVAAYGRNQPREPLSEPRRAPVDEIAEQVRDQRIGCLCGFASPELADAISFEGEVVVPVALAPVAARVAERETEWDPGLLSRPLYLRGPAVTVPGGRG